MTFEQEIDLAAVLALLVTRTGELEGRLRVQKLMYFLQQKGVRALEPAFFEYHHYGPFSADVVDILNISVSSKIVEEHEERDGDWKKYTYRPQENAERYAGKVDGPSRSIIEEVLDVCTGVHWRVLELAATSDFLRRAESLDWDGAFQAALVRKPACKPYEAQARKLLADLRLS